MKLSFSIMKEFAYLANCTKADSVYIIEIFSDTDFLSPQFSLLQCKFLFAAPTTLLNFLYGYALETVYVWEELWFWFNT